MAEGEFTPQRDPQARDIDQRRQNLRAFNAYERENLPHGRDRVNELNAMDREFLNEQHYDPTLPHQMDDAAFSERHRVNEITGPFIDQAMERYMGRVAAVENARVERKYGTGRLSRMKRWFGDTVVGSRVHYAGEVTLGALCHGLSAAAPIGAPLFNFLAAKFISNGVVEAFQKEMFEIPRIRRLQQLRLGRHYWIRELARLRNLYSGQSPTGDPYGRVDVVGAVLPAPTAAQVGTDIGARGTANAMDAGARWSSNEDGVAYPGAAGAPSAEYANPATTLDRRLEIIIEQADLIEDQIQRTEQELENIKRIGRGIKAVVGLAISVDTLYELYTNGLSMGVQNFDAGLEAANGLVANPHEVFLNAHGVQFAYNAGEIIPAGAKVSEVGGQAMHAVGVVAPWLKIGATAGGLLGAMLHSTLGEFGAMGGHAARAQAIAEDRENPNADNQAVLTLNGRGTHGDASGVHHEIEHVNNMTPVRDREEMNERKELMVPGSVWRINPVHLPPGFAAAAAAPGVVTSGTDVFYQVIGWEGQNLKFTFITNDASGNLKNGIILGPRNIAKNPDSMIMNSRLESNSILSVTPEGRINKILENRGEDIVTNKNRVVKNPIIIGARTIPVGHYLETSRPSKDRVTVRVFSGPTTEIAPIQITDANLPDLERILENSEIITTRAEAEKGRIKEANKAELNQINSIVKDHFASRNVDNLAPGQFYSLGANDWIVINTINDEVPGGQISYIRGDNFTTINSLANDKLKKKEIEKRIREGDAARVPPQNFATFLTFIDTKSGTDYANPMIYQFK